jgi:hypothetical protein
VLDSGDKNGVVRIDPNLYCRPMKNMIRRIALALLFVAASVAYGGVPPVNVTVADSGGKAAFKGTTNASGAFATANLKPGNYVVQFVSNSAATKGHHYAIVVSAGKKKVAASAVPGEKLAGGGVAMKVDVGPGLNITGQVAAEASGAVKNGKKMVWIGSKVGSNMPGHWVEEDSPEAKEARVRGTLDLGKAQDRSADPHQEGFAPGH